MADNPPEDVLVDFLGPTSDPAKQEMQRSMVEGAGDPDRSWFANLLLAGLLGGGFIMFSVLAIEFFIFDNDLFNDPSSVWVHTLWFAPMFLVVFLSFQTLVMGLKTKAWSAPSVWMAITAMIGFVFAIVPLFFYQRLFWQCVTNTGDFHTIETDICDNHLTELSTIAWINVCFLIHAFLAILAGVIVYSSDTSRFGDIKSSIISGAKGARKHFRKIRLPKRSSGQAYPSFVAGQKLNQRKSRTYYGAV